MNAAYRAAAEAVANGKWGGRSAHILAAVANDEQVRTELLDILTWVEDVNAVLAYLRGDDG